MNITQLNSNNPKVDIVVHIDEHLDEQNRQRIEYAMIKQVGIERARFNNDRHHLLIINYDPTQTSSFRILNLIQRQKLTAQLIGGI